MKAAVWHGRKDVRIEEVPDPPAPPPGQVQLEVTWCGICGTDLHEFFGGPLYIPLSAAHPATGIRAPVIIGHEISGRIVAVGEGVSGLRLGDRVAVCPIVGCLSCRWCSSGAMGQCDRVAFVGTSWNGGGFAERLNLNAYQCYPLPSAISDERGALVEPFSATARAVLRGEVDTNSSVAVIGAGPIGLMAVLAASIRGAKRVIAVEVAAKRLETAKQCGATAVINPLTEDPFKRADEITQGQGFDVVVECAGHETSGLLASRLARTRGRIVVMGVFTKPSELDYTDLVFREKTITGSMGGYGFYPESIEMMAARQFAGDVLVTDHIRLDDLVQKGFSPLINEPDKHVKILVSPF